MTRIIGGAARGRRLKTPTGIRTRPTSDRVREALFSALESELGTLAGARFLDLFAGSGAVGLEASSRGAAAVVLVEQDRATAALIRANARTLGLEGVTVHAAKAERVAETIALDETRFDVVFADPPYSMDPEAVAAVLSGLLGAGLVAADAVIVVERPRRGDGWVWPLGMKEMREKRYGETMLFYGQVTGSPDSPPGSGPGTVV